MTITAMQKQEIEVGNTVDVQTPCFLKNKITSRYYFINNEGALLTVQCGQITNWAAGEKYTAEEIVKAIKESYPCQESEFKDALDAAQKIIEETYTGAHA